MRHPSIMALAVGLMITACTAGNITPPPGPKHLYLGDDGLPASLRVYALPLSATSRPVVAIPVDKPYLLGMNAVTLAVTGLVGDMRLFSLPLTANSSSVGAIRSESNGTPVFAAGLLYQGGVSGINVFAPPFSTGVVPASTISTPGVSPSYLAADSSGNLYETTGGNTIGAATAASFTILTAGPAVAFRGMATTTTRLIVCGFDGPANDVFIYTLPLTETAAPVVTINLGDAAPEACVLDASGKLYVGSPDGRILVFAPPFSSASMPELTLQTPAVIYGMAIGP